MQIPVIGWIFSFVFAFFLAIPLYYIWNFLAPIYFNFLPPVWMSVPFWHMVLLCMLFPALKFLIMPSVDVTCEK